MRKIAKWSALGGLTACCLLPDQYYPGKLKPISHMLTVAKAGIQMICVYYFRNATLSEKHIEAGQYLRDAMLKNGGIYIKLGQLIASLDVIVPDQYRATMMTLTRGCQASTFENVKKIVEQATGKPIQETFSKFQRDPISSASIGQVHKAQLKTGQQVAVKIQHQNLAQNVFYDIQLMWMFSKIAKWMFKQFKYEWLIDEFQKNIKLELDFRLEAENMKKVEQMLQKQKFKNVTVPKLLLPPTQKMLVMEFINGFHVDEIQKMKSMHIQTKDIGRTFSKVIIKMIHQYGFVHADPHSGNMLIRKDKQGHDQLVLLDHGLYQKLGKSAREQYNWFWLGLILGDIDMSTKAANQLGTKNGQLLCCMLTSQTKEQLDSRSGSMFNLNPLSDKREIMKHAQQWQPQIVTLLNEIQREFLLLFKVNQFARNIQNMLGGRQIGVYEDIARCCVDNLPISTTQKWKYKWDMLWASRGK